ncbi:hypothetical protein [Cellulophaga sp. HaHa_2_1]|uniref:hypothetical protein n=1 Tax=Cellulophaga sp. HaHa_2_1 TaxID=2749994 RepID=UPI001C4F37ED|nr:hypothetical protein [Cellulophaga sp. HaHa_2_1]QXP52974.1 hypothetical protein H0I24_03335 [Cellulophaga sp. HaHa_2_1]
MSNLEHIKKLQKLKKSLRKGNTSTNSIDDADANILRNKVSNGLKKSLKKQEFKLKQNSDSSEPWRTDRDNKLNGYTGYGIDKSKKKKLDSNLDNTASWWTKPFDVSFKNPWPEARWDWFEDRQGGDYVYGPKRNGNEGRHRGVNGKIYTSYQGDDIAGFWSGGGTSLTSWAHKINLVNQMLKGVQTVNGTIERVDKISKLNFSDDANTNLRNLSVEEKAYFLKNPHLDSIRLNKSLDTLYTYKKILPNVEHWNGKLWEIGTEEQKDTILDKKEINKALKNIHNINKKNRAKAYDIFENGDY